MEEKNQDRSCYIEEIRVSEGHATVQGYKGDPMQVAWMLERLNQNSTSESGKVRHLVAGLLLGLTTVLVFSVALRVRLVSPLISSTCSTPQAILK